MHFKKLYVRILPVILALVSMLLFTHTPVFGKESLDAINGTIITLQIEPPALNSSFLVAKKGCEETRSAKTNLQTAKDKLNGIKSESKNLRRAFDDTRNALEYVNTHLQSC